MTQDILRKIGTACLRLMAPDGPTNKPQTPGVIFVMGTETMSGENIAELGVGCAHEDTVYVLTAARMAIDRALAQLPPLEDGILMTCEEPVSVPRRKTDNDKIN